MLETFQAQIEAGGPLTVTHPDVRRYFMTTAEAVELVIQAGAIGGPGEVLVLDMGAPVLIAELAGRLAGLADRRLDIVYTGLRPGEKIDEVLFGIGEADTRGAHPMIAHVGVLPLAVSELEGLDLRAPREELVHGLQALCVTGDAGTGSSASNDKYARAGRRRTGRVRVLGHESRSEPQATVRLEW